MYALLIFTLWSMLATVALVDPSIITSHRKSYKADTTSTKATYGNQSTTTSSRSSKDSHRSSSKGHKKYGKKPDASSIETDLLGIGSHFSSSDHQANHWRELEISWYQSRLSWDITCCYRKGSCQVIKSSIPYRAVIMVVLAIYIGPLVPLGT
jgi:hypothetical protein